ncbi:transposase [Variovorax sp. ZT4R33]|uniref:transposase n=1 Tax=Variovorax sp. ZT4R33 TaxID=3443743 RepID=UPI003F45CC67
MRTIEPEASAKPGRTRRRHSDDFKNQLVDACRQPGVSLASVALIHGINPSLLRRWVVQSHGATSSLPALSAPAPSAHAQFVPMRLHCSEAPADGVVAIEIKRSGLAINLSWPAADAQGCTAMLRELLR